MGEQTYNATASKEVFIKAVLEDVSAFEHMLYNDWFESDIIRIGAEQEIVLIDPATTRPSLKGPEILEKCDYPWLVSELAKFNLELNLSPQVFKGRCLHDMEKELKAFLKILRGHLHEEGIDYLLTGILPTLHKYHLDLENLTPKQRYRDLMSALHGQLRNQNFELRLVGIDELLVRHDSPLLEACNTSFQVHLQVAPQDFKTYYNYALALTAPCISLSANSPIVFGKRLWHETRIALFQQAIDTRKTHDHMRQMSPRVILGDSWLDGDVTEIFKDNIARFRTLLFADMGESSMSKIEHGEVPKLKSLQLHNSTVYRWNRPCYGISDTGKPHLRIENRVFPSGPTVIDEMANTAFWLGAMRGMAKHYPDIRQFMSFADVRDNFAKASRFGLDATFSWIKDKKVAVPDLVLNELIDISREGLESMNVASEDIDRYLGVIEERMKSYMNGARWMLRTYTSLKEKTSSIDEALTYLTASIYKEQNKEDIPVHLWPEIDPDESIDYHIEDLRVSEFMAIDLYTVQREDLIDLVFKLMKWKNMEFLPVENDEGQLVGLISAKSLLEKLTELKERKDDENIKVEKVMIKQPITVGPEATLKEASELMEKQSIGCLPVVKGQELIGMVTEKHILSVTNRLLKKKP